MADSCRPACEEERISVNMGALRDGREVVRPLALAGTTFTVFGTKLIERSVVGKERYRAENAITQCPTRPECDHSQGMGQNLKVS